MQQHAETTATTKERVFLIDLGKQKYSVITVFAATATNFATATSMLDTDRT